MKNLDTLVQYLTSLFREKDEVVGIQLAQQASDLTDLAIHFGALRRTGRVQRLTCPLCDELHSAQVIRKHNGYALDCLRSKGVTLTEEDISVFEPSIDALIDHFIQALAVRRSSPALFANGHLIELGFVETPDDGDPWCALFCFGLLEENVFASVLDAVSKQTRKGPGLLITADPIPRTIPLPSKYRWARPSEVWRIGEDRFITDRLRIDELLGRKRIRRKGGGRKNRLGDVTEAVRRFKIDADWPSLPADQYRFLSDHWPQDLGKCPSRTTLFEKLASLQEGDSKESGKRSIRK